MIYRIGTMILPLVLFVVAATGAWAQVKIDVKTTWKEKKGLAVLKNGVLGSLDAADRFQSVEFGEDYALWLRDIKRNLGNGDTVLIELQLEVRKPSLFQKGDLISSGTVSISYNKRMLDSIASDSLLLQDAQAYQQRYESINNVITSLAIAVLPKAKLILVPLVNSLLREVNGAPRLQEICEATLVGAQVVLTLEEMLSQE